MQESASTTPLCQRAETILLSAGLGSLYCLLWAELCFYRMTSQARLPPEK
jgi:hypothetical protein